MRYRVGPMNILGQQIFFIFQRLKSVGTWDSNTGFCC